MKSATGMYYNLFSSMDSDNYGLNVKFDIVVIFPESFGSGYMSDIWDTLEDRIEVGLRKLGRDYPFAKKKNVKEVVKNVLDTLDYEYERIIVEQALSDYTLSAIKSV